MKHVFVQCSLAAALLAAMAVPLFGNGAKTADRNANRTVENPQHLANSWPTPWPCTGKSCTAVLGETPNLIANSWPTPWPKTPDFVLG